MLLRPLARSSAMALDTTLASLLARLGGRDAVVYTALGVTTGVLLTRLLSTAPWAARLAAPPPGQPCPTCGRGDGDSDGSSDGSGSDDDDGLADEDGVEDSKVVPPHVELKMVICVRQDLNMSKGKIAAQVGHAVLACYRIAVRKTPEFVKAWLYRAQAKITLKVDSEEQMDAIAAEARRAGLAVCAIEDAGRTEVEPGTRTVLGIGPAPKADIDKITGPKGKYPLRLLA